MRFFDVVSLAYKR